MFFVKTVCGDEAEMMLEEVLKHGYITASEVIVRTYKRMQQSPCKQACVLNVWSEMKLMQLAFDVIGNFLLSNSFFCLQLAYSRQFLF